MANVFSLINSFPADGDIVLPSVNRFALNFNRNVVSNNVWANNLKQIDVWQGFNRVAVRLVKGTSINGSSDSIFIFPVDPLLAGRTYKIRIKSSLEASNGETLGEFILIVFTTL